MFSEQKPTTEQLPKSFEKMILSELGVKSLKEITNAMENKTWPFKIQPKDLWKKIADYFEQPISIEDIADLLTGKKTEEEIKASIEKKQWPFNITEEEMRKNI